MIALSPLPIRPPSAVLRHKRAGSCLLSSLITAGMLLLLICGCMGCALLLLSRMQFPDFVMEAKGLALYNFTFGCAFDEPAFIAAAVKGEVEEKAMHCGEISSEEWNEVAALWRAAALKRATAEQFDTGDTWPQEAPKVPVYILLCSSLGVVVGQDPQTHQVQFAVDYKGLRFSELTEWSYPHIQSWEAIQVKVWEPGIPWTELPTALPELQSCLSGH